MRYIQVCNAVGFTILHHRFTHAFPTNPQTESATSQFDGKTAFNKT